MFNENCSSYIFKIKVCNKMTKNVSIIIPFYKGWNYIDQFTKTINEAYKYANQHFNLSLQVIIINDNPKEKISMDNFDSFEKNILINIFNNEINHGLHKNRVLALDKAKYEYVHFLDQDDTISKDFYYELISSIGDNDVIVSNCFKEDENNNLIQKYNNAVSFSRVSKLSCYINDGNMIISPGQCLIKKNSIPIAWKQNIFKTNGSDDYFLWILYLCNKQKIVYSKKGYYIHKYTGANLSNSLKNMLVSDKEMISILSTLNIKTKIINRLNKTNKIHFEGLNKNKYLHYTKHPIFAFRKLFWKLINMIKTLYYEI